MDLALALHDFVMGKNGRPPETITCKRLEYLFQPGDAVNHLFLVKSGAMRAFYLTPEEEYTLRFGYNGSIITVIPSFYDQTPSQLYWQALRTSTLLKFSKTDFLDFIAQDKTAQKGYQAFLEQFACQQFERELDLIVSSPKERFERLRSRNPQVFEAIPLKYIAAYLRMTPETLSRLRNS